MKVVELNSVVSKLESIREHESERGKSTGYRSLDEFYTIIQGNTTIISGHPTSGKSSLYFQFLCNLTCQYNWRHAIHSPETGQAEDIYAKIIHILTGKTFNKKYDNYITEKEMYNVIPFVHDFFKVIEPANDSMSVDEYYELATQIINEFEVHTIGIDNWNDLEHKFQGQVSEYLKSQIPRFNRFCKKMNVHGFLLAHPRNPDMRGQKALKAPRPDELEGGSLWYAKAQSLLVAHHDWSNPNDYTTEIYIHKAKPKTVGKKGFITLQFAAARDCYFEEINGRYYYPETPFKESANPTIFEPEEDEYRKPCF